MLPNLDDLDLSQVEIMKFCGLPAAEVGGVYLSCKNEAVGELTVPIAGTDQTINMPVCQSHLDQISATYEVTEVDSGEGILLD